MRVTIPDETVAKYEPMAEKVGLSLEEVLHRQLDRFAKLEVGKRAILLQANQLQSVEGALGGLPIKDAEDLLARLRQHASIRFAGIDLDLTPAQKLELVHRAERQGKTVEQLLQEHVAWLNSQVFYTMGGGVAKAG